MRVFDCAGSAIGGGGESLLGGFALPEAEPAPLAAAARPEPPAAARIAAATLAGAIGVSVGTARIVSAAVEADGSVVLRAERNAFLALDDDAATRRFLASLDVARIERDGRLDVVGDAAFEVARILGRETRRPMRDGFVSPDEPDALFRLASLLERTVGRSRSEDRAAFSVPSDGVPGGDPRVIYHRGVVEKALSRLGYRPLAVSEGLAVVLSELSSAEDAFTGIGLSFGAGRTSFSIAHRGIEVDGFSIERGGDWIDAHAAKALGATIVEAASAKESGIDLAAPRGREAAAIAALLKNWIGGVVEAIRDRLAARGRELGFRAPLPVVASGGAALAAGFADVLRGEIERAGGLGFPVGSVRVAATPLESVARGCLVAASLADE